jgi:peptide/nickel transport system permease protein
MGIKKRTGVLIFFSAVMLAGITFGCMGLPGLDAGPIYSPLRIPDDLHLLGTDNSGRDILALLIRSTGISLSIGLGAAICAVFIGALVGCAAGYWRSPVDDLLMRLADVFLLVPILPLIIVLTAYLGPGAFHVALVIALTAWPATARVIYAHVLTLREQPFVVNAKSMGAGSVYLMMRHILPNCTELLLAKAALTVAGAMLAEAGISFLGLGDPVHPSWGSMLYDAFTGAAMINGYGWWYLPPILCISSSVVLFNLAGYFLFDAKVLAASPVMPAAFACTDCSTRPKPPVSPLLSIGNLTIGFLGSTGQTRLVVDQLNFDLYAGEKVAVIGATGSGKSLLLLSVLGLLPAGAKVTGYICIEGADLAGYSAAALRRHRGVFAAYVPQGLGNALNPVLTVGYQVAERVHIHQGLDQGRALRAAVASLSAVGFVDPDQRIADYPHHLSGGMKQRVLLAMALSGNPSLILADEPTKGLDQSAVNEILEIFKGLESKTVLAVTHDLRFAQTLGGRVLVMYSGLVVEDAPADSFFHAPLHPYSRALVAAGTSREMVVDRGVEMPETILEDGGCPWRRQCLSAIQQCEICPSLRFHWGHHIRCWCDVS